MAFLSSYPIPIVSFDALAPPLYNVCMIEVHIPPIEDNGSSKGTVDIMSKKDIVDGEMV